ncbi:MAG: protein kinase [Kofleriaceae bacterium]
MAPVPPSRARIAPGRKLGRYLLQERLGHGGMGEVWRATVEGPGGFAKPVVLKMVRADLAARPALIEMLIKEAALAARLSHPNLVPVFDLDHADGTYFYAMEHVVGHSLSTIMARAQHRQVRLPDWLVAAVAVACCEGLHYAHDMTDATGQPLGLVHRDVSLANVMVSKAGCVSLLDFGIATTAVAGVSPRKSRALIGKFQYLPPEVVRGDHSDRRADIYSLGVMMLVCLTGAMPYRAVDDEDLLRQILAGPPPDLDARLRGVAAPLAKVIRAAMTRDPIARPATMAAVASALRTYQRDAGHHPTAADLAHFVAWVFEDEDDDDAITDTVAEPLPEESKELQIVAAPEAPAPRSEGPLGTPTPRDARERPLASGSSDGFDAFTARPRREPAGADLFASTPVPRATRGVFDDFVGRAAPTPSPDPDAPAEEPPLPRRWPW